MHGSRSPLEVHIGMKEVPFLGFNVRWCSASGGHRPALEAKLKLILELAHSPSSLRILLKSPASLGYSCSTKLSYLTASTFSLLSTMPLDLEGRAPVTASLKLYGWSQAAKHVPPI